MESLAFAAEGKVSAQVEKRPLQQVNAVLSELKAGLVRGRIVLTMG